MTDLPIPSANDTDGMLPAVPGSLSSETPLTDMLVAEIPSPPWTIHVDGLAKVCRAFEKKNREMQRERSWQPIESAPRDGTEILVTGLDNGTGPTRHTLMARWEKCPHFGDHFTDRSSGSTALEYLTHWMPLPPSPENVQGDGSPDNNV